ncbi:CRISPR-associated protein Cas4 [Halobacterium noricense]|uniref:CRISPR-associated protein Cas4 n=1 Tax=Halobacterium noricense TaxID=223182 RepID=UPI001E62B333|nr:PD-(D/E)XK nuclease family protein [Halobacterium noricense]UHH27227.1 PD-(D/E)XK nuclease family protein [Halobacterium noricense]
MPDDQANTPTTEFLTPNRAPEADRRKRLLDAITNESFNDWYQEEQFTENILEGRPYFNGASPPPAAEKHSPSKLLQCHRKVRYYAENAPKEGDAPQGLFWIGSAFEEEIVVPYLLDAVTTENTYVRNSMWIDTTIDDGGAPVRVKGVTDPVLVDSSGDPILVMEIKTTSSVSYLDSPKPHHKAQLHAYMYALDAEYDRSLRDGVLLYGGRDTLDIEVFHVQFDESFWQDRVVPWMRAQTQYRSDEVLPPADPVSDWECDTCPFRIRCGQANEGYEDVGFTGLLPGVDGYRKHQLVEYFDAYPDAKLTPTLAHQFPALAEEHGVYDWHCPTCGATYAWDAIDIEAQSPLCERCVEDDELCTVAVPMPESQNIH